MLEGPARGRVLGTRGRKQRNPHSAVTILAWGLSLWVGGGGWPTRASRAPTSRWPQEGLPKLMTVRAEMPGRRSEDALRPVRRMRGCLLAIANEGWRWRPFSPPHPGPGGGGARRGKPGWGGQGQATGRIRIVAGPVRHRKRMAVRQIHDYEASSRALCQGRIAFLDNRLRGARAALVALRRLLKVVPGLCWYCVRNEGSGETE